MEEHGLTYCVVTGSDRYICRVLVAPLGIEPNGAIARRCSLSNGMTGDIRQADGL